MKFSEYAEKFGDVDMAEAYAHFLIDNHEKYVIVSIRADGMVDIKHGQTKEQFAESLIRGMSRVDGNFYIFKRSDVDKFIRSGSDILKILGRSNGKEVAKRIRKELKKND